MQHQSLDMERVMDYVDEYTIGIVGIMGITYTGRYDDIKKLDALVEEYNKHTDYKVYIHVDAASGGLYTPFMEPDIEWDFKLKNVVSINASGHKYGLVYPGIGWVLWRDKSFLPEELIFKVSYLGGEIPTMAINFSRSASQIILFVTVIRVFMKFISGLMMWPYIWRRKLKNSASLKSLMTAVSYRLFAKSKRMMSSASGLCMT